MSALAYAINIPYLKIGDCSTTYFRSNLESIVLSRVTCAEAALLLG